MLGTKLHSRRMVMMERMARMVVQTILTCVSGIVCLSFYINRLKPLGSSVKDVNLLSVSR